MIAFRLVTGSKRPRQFLLVLLLILVATSSSEATAAGSLTAGLGSYLLYSFGVQKYANHVVSKMIAVPHPEEVPQPETDPPIFASDLRKTISRITNLVTNPADRLKWHQWIARNDPKLDASITKETILAWVSHGTDSPSPLFRFAYRTHADYEEAAAFYKPFWTWQRFKFTFETPTKMVFTEQPTTSTKRGIASVQMTDYLILYGILKAHVTWKGAVVRGGGKYDYQIDWDSTELKTFLPWTKHRPKITPNPAASAAASKAPWYVVKAEDGMICLKRGTVGYLVFDSKKR